MKVQLEVEVRDENEWGLELAGRPADCWQPRVYRVDFGAVNLYLLESRSM